MAKILFTWELGCGLGHVTVVKPLAIGLADLGHQVFVAVPDIARARELFPLGRVHLLQAPRHVAKIRDRIRPAANFAHILNNTCFNCEDQICATVLGWRSLIDGLGIDLMVCDHSPTALLATQGRPLLKATIGTGFCSPPSGLQFPSLRPQLKAYSPSGLREHEARVLTRVNNALKQLGLPRLERLSALYSQVHANLLTTIPELDHYQNRTDGGNYYGNWSDSIGIRPSWPRGNGPAIFAYLRYRPELDDQFRMMSDCGARTVAFIVGAPAGYCAQSQTAGLRLVSQPVDFDYAAGHCDLAVSQGGHGTAVHFLLSGTPQLVLSTQLEQDMTGRNLQRQGVGATAPSKDRVRSRQSLSLLLNNTAYSEKAQQIADKYSGFEREQSRQLALESLTNLLDGPVDPAAIPTIDSLEVTNCLSNQLRL